MARIITTADHDGSVQPPLSIQQWQDRYPILCHCLTFRGASWLQTYLSVDGTRSVSEYDAPYAEVIHEVFRETHMAFDAIWHAEVQPMQKIKTPIFNPVLLELTHHNTPGTEIAPQKILHQSLEKQGISTLYTLTAVTQKHSIWVLEANALDTFQPLDQQLDLPLKRIWRSHLLINPAFPPVSPSPLW